jgi:hypothetical protein
MDRLGASAENATHGCDVISISQLIRATDAKINPFGALASGSLRIPTESPQTRKMHFEYKQDSLVTVCHVSRNKSTERVLFPGTPPAPITGLSTVCDRSAHLFLQDPAGLA